MRRLLPSIVLAMLFLCGWRLTALRADEIAAEDVDRLVRAHFDVGQLHYKAGRYAEAITAFELAYRQKPLPSLLYNIAQAARLGGQTKKALDDYHRYLERVPDAPERTVVARYIEELSLEAQKNDALLLAKTKRDEDQVIARHQRRTRLAIALGISAAVVAVGAVTLGLTLGLTRAPPSTTLGVYTPR